MAAAMVRLVHLAKARATKTIYSRVPLHAKGANIAFSQSRWLQNSVLILRFIYHTTKIIFTLCTCLLQRNRSLDLGSIKPKWGRVSTFHFRPQSFVHKLPSTFGHLVISLPSTNFCPQTSVHKLLSTNFRRHLVPHNTHSLLACARMNELKKQAACGELQLTSCQRI